MSKHTRSRSAPANTSRLQSLDQEDRAIIQMVIEMVIETPKGTRNKYRLIQSRRFLSLRKSCLQEWLSLRLRVHTSDASQGR
jgi:hypothetical protein